MLRLLPQPRHVRVQHGAFSPQRVLYVADAPQDAGEGVRLALFDLMTECRSASQIPVYPTSRTRQAAIRTALLQKGPVESYTLTVSPDAINIVGDGCPGLFYGIQTLRQLVRQFGLRIPCCVIRDQPSFSDRAFYLDISRGRVPRLGTLRQWVDLLAHLKINQLQLYVEHVFAFSFDPDISKGCDALTPQEVDALASYCRTRHIEFVPSLACFGHMGRVLSLPAYRNLAEIRWPASSWEESLWIQRLRGATINPRLQASRVLLSRMLRDFLPHFPSTLFNMCGDETYDLGRGANRAWVERHGMARLYVQHVRFLCDESARYQKRLMLWGDMLLKYPDAIRKLPRECIVLDWGYEASMDFAKVRQFLDAGLEAYVCPSTRGYRVVFNEVEKARANITGYAREGQSAGARGILITDWGDMGHFNVPAASLHGLALGAAMAWNTTGDFDKHFDRAFSLQLFGDEHSHVGHAFNRAGGAEPKEWPLMLTDIPEAFRHRGVRAKAERAFSVARKCRNVFAALGLNRGPGILPSPIRGELLLACDALALTAEKVLLFTAARHPSRKMRNAYAEKLRDFFDRYAALWRLHYKLLGLRDLEKAWGRAYKRLRGGAEPLTRQDLP